MGVKLTKKMQQEFDNFIKDIPQNLNYLQETLKTSKKYEKTVIGYTPDLVDKIENFYLDVLEGEELPNIDKEKLYNAFFTFIGEAVIKNAKGNWEWCTIKADEAFNTPIILNWGNKDYGRPRISPKVAIKILINDKERGGRGMLKEMIVRLQKDMKS